MKYNKKKKIFLQKLKTNKIWSFTYLPIIVLCCRLPVSINKYLDTSNHNIILNYDFNFDSFLFNYLSFQLVSWDSYCFIAVSHVNSYDIHHGSLCSDVITALNITACLTSLRLFQSPFCLFCFGHFKATFYKKKF